MPWRSVGEIVDPEADVSSTIGCSFSTMSWVTGVVVAALGGGPNESTGEGCAGEAAEDACDAAAAAE